MAPAESKVPPQAAQPVAGSSTVEKPEEIIVDTVHQDEAMKVLAAYNSNLEWTDQEEKTLRRKLDWRLMPVLCCTYFLQHYDKAMLSHAAIFGLREDLGILKGDGYSLSAAIFYVGFILGAYPIVALAQRYPIERVASITITLWGFCLILTTVCVDRGSLLAQRFFLGLLESGVSPIFMVVVAGFYKKDEQPYRLGMFYAFSGLSAMLSPLANWGLGRANGGVSSWRYMYYVAGAITIAWGILVWWVLPPDPVRAKGFGDRERYILVARLRTNNSGVRNTHFKIAQVLELLTDLRFWTAFSTAFLASIANGPLSNFIPIIVNGMGYDEFNSLLLKMPTGAYGGVVVITASYLANKIKGIRTYIVATSQVLTILSALLLWLLPASANGGLLFAIYILPSWTAGYSIIMSLQIANTAGYTKKTLSSAGLFIGYCLGNVVGPLVFKSEDAPRFKPGFLIVVVTSGIALLLSLFYRFICVYSNQKRDKEGTLESFEHAFEDDLTDKTNRHFRFVL